jgi:opacity protein-like surface antigen
MRTLAVVSIALLLLPAGGAAQRQPVPRTGTVPGRPVPIGKQPEPIARAQEFQRLRVSAESYPMASYLRAPGFPDPSQPTSWTTVGAGSRLEYRLTPRAAATLDLTSSLDGSPMRVQTLEIGGRLRRAPSESRVTPYADVRVGFILAEYSGASGTPGFTRPTSLYMRSSSHGFGAVAGVGVEYAMTNTWAVTTGASLMQSRLSTSGYDGSAAPASYGMTSNRITLGIKYNPVRSMVLKSER